MEHYEYTKGIRLYIQISRDRETRKFVCLLNDYTEYTQ